MTAYCLNPKCRNVFDARGISIANPNVIVTMTNNYTRCPKCGFQAKWLDGTFKFDRNGIATLLSGPQITIDIIQRLKDLSQEAIDNKYSNDVFLQKAKEISPILDLLKKFLPEDIKESRGYFYTLLISLLILFLDKGLDYNKDQKENLPTVITNTNNISNTYINYNLSPPKKAFIPKQRKPVNKKLRILK